MRQLHELVRQSSRQFFQLFFHHRTSSSNNNVRYSSSSYRYNNNHSTMSSTANPQQQTRGRCMEMIENTPLVTFSIVLICLGIFIYDNVVELSRSAVDFSIVPYLVLYEGQWYRLITSAFVHGGLVHIGMNMLSLFSLGQSLESLFGTLQFFFLILLYLVGCGLFYLLLSGIAYFVWSPAALYGGAVGFSGVLFALAVDESSLSPMPTRSVYGLFNVPTKLYPWVLMLIIQLILPRVSFMGHLAGIFMGMLHTAGWLRWCIPSLITLRKLEQAACMRPLFRFKLYKLVPNADVVMDRNSSASTISLGIAWIGMVLAPVTQCIGRVVPAPVHAWWGGVWSRIVSMSASVSAAFTRAGTTIANIRTSSSTGSSTSRVVDGTGRLQTLNHGSSSSSGSSGSSGTATMTRTTIAGGGGGGKGGGGGGGTAAAGATAIALPVATAPPLSSSSASTSASNNSTGGGGGYVQSTALASSVTAAATAAWNMTGAAASNNSFGYEQLTSREEEEMDGVVGGRGGGRGTVGIPEEEEEREDETVVIVSGDATSAGAGAAPSSSANPSASTLLTTANQATTPTIPAKESAQRAEARAKALAAAEARAAAAASRGAISPRI